MLHRIQYEIQQLIEMQAWQEELVVRLAHFHVHGHGHEGQWWRWQAEAQEPRLAQAETLSDARTDATWTSERTDVWS